MKHASRQSLGIAQTITAHVLRLANEKQVTPGQAANELADEMASQLHPIWPKRSRDIQICVRDEWCA